MLKIRTTKQFERDYKLIVRQGKDLAKLKRVMHKLVNEEPLENRHHDHPLTGNWKGHRDRGGRVCLDSLKQFLSGKLLCLMPLPAFAVV